MHSLKEKQERLLRFLQRGGKIIGQRSARKYEIATPTISKNRRTLSLIDISMNFTEGKIKFTYLTLDNRFDTEQDSEILLFYPLESRFKVYFSNGNDWEEYFNFIEDENDGND